MPRQQDGNRPTGYHWGRYESTSDLPNVSGSANQEPLLDRGDIASVGAALYRCTMAADLHSATWEAIPASGAGDVVGPSGGADNVVVRFDGTTGKLIQESDATIDDDGKLSLIGAAATLIIDPDDGGVTDLNIFTGTGNAALYVNEAGTDDMTVLLDASGPDALPQVWPAEDSTYNLGADSYRWLTGYVDTLDASTQLYVGLGNELSVSRTQFLFGAATSTSAPQSYLRASDGANATGNAYNGGALEVSAGSGGTSTSAGNGGSGADLTLLGGDGGAASAGEFTDGAGGDATIDAGAGAGSASDGDVYVGPTNAFAVHLGKSGGRVGFYGTTPAVIQDITGSKGANAALTSLLTALATLGLITDSTT